MKNKYFWLEIMLMIIVLLNAWLSPSVLVKCIGVGAAISCAFFAGMIYQGENDDH